MRDGKLEIGLIGCGAFGDQRAHGLMSIAGAELVTVYDPAASRADALARTYSTKAVTSLSELWDETGIDAVIIASPSDTHVELTRAAANAGKHVLVEKPVALSINDLDTMQRTCDEAGVTLLVGQTLRFHTVAQGFYRSRHDGAIGDPVYFNWVSGSNRLWPGGWRGWQTESERSGGITLHLAIHNIDLALWLLDSPPARVYAQGVNAGAPGLDVPNCLQISVRCENGANALLEVHTSIAGRGASFLGGRLLGTRGQTEWSMNEDGVLFSDSGTRLVFPGYSQSIHDELVHFIDCCTGRTSPLVTPDQSRYALASGIAANRSLRSGDVVEVSELLEEAI